MVAIVSQSGGPFSLPPLMPCFPEKDLAGCCAVLGGNILARLQEWRYLVEFIPQFVATFFQPISKGWPKCGELFSLTTIEFNSFHSLRYGFPSNQKGFKT
jgi:hypothetical protein